MKPQALSTIRALLALGLLLLPVAARAAVTGNIEGTVTDQVNRKPLAGVTVTVTSPALQGEQSEFTDGAGHYIITDLPPGEYLVRFYFSSINVERPGVLVQADKTLAVNVAFPTQKAEVKTYRITEKAPTVDVGNTQVQTQVSQELVKNTPVRGRTYNAVLTMAPGASTDAQGLQFGGATGLENNFLIDGVNTTSVGYGRIGTQLTLEFIGETEVITGGYNAEYGRATGGVVNVITKTGSNSFHGDIWLNSVPFQMLSPLLGRSGEALASREHMKYQLDFGFDLGGPIVKDKVWFYVGFTPTFTSKELLRYVRTRSAMDAIPAGLTRYAGDLDPAGGCPAYLDPIFCDPNNHLTAPGFKTTVIDQGRRTFANDNRLYNWITKFNFQFNPNNSLVLQYIGSPNTSSGYRDTGDRFFGNLNGGDGQLLATEFANTHDAQVHFISKLLDRRLQIDAVVGYHYSDIKVTPNVAGAVDQARVTDLRSRDLSVFEAGLDPCAPVMLPGGVAFSPCPVQNYLYGGFGEINHYVEQRITAALSATYFAKLLGTHALKLGFDFEDNIYYHPRFNSGGPNGGLFSVSENFLGINVRRRQFGRKGPGDLGELTPEGFAPTTGTLNYMVYLRDSYNVGFLPGLTLNAGVRWEAQQVKASDKSIVIALYDNWAPRVGGIWDFTRKGRGKLYASYGWYFESIPLDINDRQFSGEGNISLNSRTACANAFDANGILHPEMCNFPQPTNGQVNGGVYGTVAPILKGQFSDEVVAGIQYDVGFDLVLGASFTHRGLGRVIEDLSPDGGATYILANPGEKTDAGVIKDLQNKIAAESNPAKQSELKKELALYKGVESFEKPKRDYNAATFTATKRLSHNFTVLASYTYSRVFGNYPGNFVPSTGQTDPNITSLYDLRELVLNTNGPLPSDRPHNIKLNGSYQIPFGNNLVTLGLAFNGSSGRPIDVLGAHPQYGRLKVHVLPVGSGGRTPFVTSLDFHVGYRRQLSKIFGFEATADVFNLFNQGAITATDDEYTSIAVDPIQNGKVSDLRFLKDLTGAQPLINPNYGKATAYQEPLSARVGLRLTF